MAKEELRTSIRCVIEEAWNKGHVDVLDEYYATNCVLHRPPYPDIKGLKGIKEMITGFRRGYPDFQAAIDEVIVDGDITALRFTFQGTHQEQGKRVTFSGFAVHHREEGKIVEQWLNWDDMGLHQQLGFVLTPPSDQGKESQP